ncbi:DUF2218 domain-containing protein [Novosphingobium pentaromativorans]|uniref:DUF2218 domain-containing protein n=1 Tax=Novosphingobium pentaromativorans US6-1 TaxID=1088721 RepID=G6EIJ2_9SPHN|nr:DUF2218 domain-containing protein [Novosphingobium pentaromativorans]AIT78814.1 hypothetical protein JI59_02795 [Novosphingobium pentaromativorans US6-1]EHJ58934.1 hypothetical protein NSU_4163 [Novosphingobium pentaromativorans US6-1]
MSTIAAKVATPNGGKYVRQVCKHWSHKFEVEVEGDTGKVHFPSAVTTMAGDEEGIAIEITGEDKATLERLTEVVANHIDRFAFREGSLNYEWSWQ